MIKFFAFLATPQFRKNLIIAIISILVFFTLLFFGLNYYTENGKSVPVPQLKGMKISEAIKVLENAGFKYEIDSSFAIDQPPGTVLEQDPQPNSAVKSNRRIYLMIVSNVLPRIKFPDLSDVPLREASGILESYGLKIGKLIYKPNLAKDAVISALLNGEELERGQSIEKGATIDLILGDGYGDSRVPIPNLIGLTLDEAIFVLQGSKLNLGTVTLSNGTIDSVNATIQEQMPAFNADSAITIDQGNAINLILGN